MGDLGSIHSTVKRKKDEKVGLQKELTGTWELRGRLVLPCVCVWGGAAIIQEVKTQESFGSARKQW